MPDITTTQIFTDGEKGITATKLNNIVANSVIQPDFVTAKPSSSTLDPTDQLLEVKGAGTYARITGSQLISSVSAQVDATPQIYSVRLRSFNALQNSTFEVDQRNVGNAVANIANNAFAQDRYQNLKAASSTFAYSAQQGSQTFSSAGYIPVPGTNFRITNSYQVITLTTQQATLAAGDYALYRQFVEGPRLRELANDVHSISILCQTNVAGGLKFSIALRDPTSTRSLVKLCTIPAAGGFNLITLPNIPVWPTAGAFSVAPGTVGYFFDICFACGSTFIAPAADVWQNGVFFGAPGMDNFCGKPTSSNLLLFFVQHEPGPVCTTLMDYPFTQNLDDCLRYYQKSYAYGTAPGTVTTVNAPQINSLASNPPYCWLPFKKPMAKSPTVVGWSPATGTFNSVRNVGGSADLTTTGAMNTGDNGFGGFTVTGPPASNWIASLHYQADTGW